MSVIDDGALTWNDQWLWDTNAGHDPAWLELVQNLNQRCDFMGVTRPTVPLMQTNPAVDPVSPVGLCSSGQTPVNARDMLSAMQTALNTLETNGAWCDSDGTAYSGFDLTTLSMTRPNLKAICENIRQSLDEHRYHTYTSRVILTVYKVLQTPFGASHYTGSISDTKNHTFGAIAGKQLRVARTINYAIAVYHPYGEGHGEYSFTVDGSTSSGTYWTASGGEGLPDIADGGGQPFPIPTYSDVVVPLDHDVTVTIYGSAFLNDCMYWSAAGCTVTVTCDIEDIP